MTASTLTITPLGGLGEIGLNCQMWESAGGVTLVDCGIMFPDDQQMGVDAVIPCMDAVMARRDRLHGLVLTHGHEDHIGAVPWLVAAAHGLKIYGSPFTLALVAHKLRERNLLQWAELHTVSAHQDLALGDQRFHFLPVSHSIPQGFALAVETPAGKVVHSGDFRLDAESNDGMGTDLAEFSRFAGEEGVHLLLADSTNAESEGFTPSEKRVRESFQEIFAAATGRIVITLFASHIERIQLVFDMARDFDRPVVVSGRSLVGNIERATDLGFLRPPPSLIIDQDLASDTPERAVIIATGSQGETYSALSRIVSGGHRRLSIREGDTVIMSSRVIPGNARAVNRLINQMYRMGANVCHDATRLVHVSGHARRGELRALIEAVRPSLFVPIHGEYRHLVQHRALALACGLPPERALILEDGRPLTLFGPVSPDGEVRPDFQLETKIPSEPVLVDGKGVGDVGNLVLRERQLLGSNGVVVVSLVLDATTGEILTGPDIASRGFIYEPQLSHILEDAKCLVLDAIEEGPGPRLAERIRSSLRSFFRNVLDRDPVIVPMITEI